MNDISRHLINEAAGKLQDIGATQEANEVIQLLAKYEGAKNRPYVDESVIEQIVKLLYPPSAQWSAEMQQRHFYHLKLALMQNHDPLNEDILRLIEMAKE